MVEVLLKNNVDIEASSDGGVKPLHLAAMGDHTQTMRLLIKKGANIEPRDSHGLTPLLLAACQGKEQAVRLLVDGSWCQCHGKIRFGVALRCIGLETGLSRVSSLSEGRRWKLRISLGAQR